MAKLKNPLLSFDAHGSLGDGLTFRRHAGGTVAEKKPRLPYFLTLPAQYQRWLYQDYASLWHQQSIDTKQFYATAGSRHHLTGYQYWMKQRLSLMDDILVWLPFDHFTPTRTFDFSKNNFEVFVSGAVPSPGVIDHSVYINGIEDYVRFYPTSIFTTAIGSIDFFVRFDTLGSGEYFLHMYQGAATDYLRIDKPDNDMLRLCIEEGDVAKTSLSTTYTFSDTLFHHVCVTHDGSIARIYIDGFLSPVTGTNSSYWLSHLNLVWYIMGRSFWGGEHAVIDNLVHYNRCLSLSEIRRHATRSYPSK